MNKSIIFFFLLLAINSGCTPVRFSKPLPFLSDLKDFKELPLVPNFYILDTSNKKIKKYSSIIIDQPAISLNRNIKYQYIYPEYIKYASDLLREQVCIELKQDFDITTIPSPSTVRLRLAITNLSLPPSREKAISVSQGNFIPVGLDNSILEAYFEDSLTGEILGGLRDARIGLIKRRHEVLGFSSPKYLSTSFAAWSGELRAVLSERFSRNFNKKLKKNNKINVQGDTTVNEFMTPMFIQAIQDDEDFEKEKNNEGPNDDKIECESETITEKNSSDLLSSEEIATEQPLDQSSL